MGIWKISTSPSGFARLPLERVGFVSGGENGSFQITIVGEEFRISNWMEMFNGQV